MLKNREFRIRVAKTDTTPDAPTTMESILNPDSVALIEDAGKRFVKQLCIAVGVTAVAIVIVDHLGEIATKLTPTH